MLYLLKFQLTRSRGAWLFYSASLQTILHFNSHAHVERDDMREKRGMTQDISTHTLTWSVTSYLSLAYDNIDISTHTLTWSVTQREKALPFMINISTHTLTWSVTKTYGQVRACISISTHTLTWSVTGFATGTNYQEAFQLTRSRGAWRECLNAGEEVKVFQLTRSRGAWRGGK